MSTSSAVGAFCSGAVMVIAGIAAYETRPEPQSAVAVCERFVSAGEGLETGIGCRQDGHPIQVIIAVPPELQENA